MNEKELYERQYGEKKLISINSFPFSRRIFKKPDFHKEDLPLPSVSLLDGAGEVA